MSQSRSSTPAHNLNFVPDTAEPTTSRPTSYDNILSESSHPLTVRLSSPTTEQLQSLEPASSSSSSRPNLLVRQRDGDNISTQSQPMAKRLRRPSPELRARPDDHSSPSSDSQEDDLADNELESRTPDRTDSQQPTSATLPPKKKRTRTLTTPHQSAVLHALLAQSRFPTTAMREEVGRSIGLSARKVQIWFQNQRQKARRPRSKSDAPMNRTQYGPFPNTPESSTGVHFFEERSIDHQPYNDAVSADLQSNLNDQPPPRLLGPGVPGAVVYQPQHSYRQIPPISAPPIEARYSMGHSSFQRASSPVYESPRAHPMTLARPATSQPTHWRERDPSRTLPPLTMTRPSSAAHGPRRLPSAPGASHPYMFSRSMIQPPRSTSPEPRFAHLPPEPISRPSLNLPPPFTLQPPPQWDESSFSTLPRPSSSVWSSSHSGARSSRGRSISPVANRREHAGSSTGSEVYYHTERGTGIRSSSPSPRSISSLNTPSSRSGRYDPVRSTFIPYSNTVESPAVSPTVTSALGGRREKRESPDPDDNRYPFREDR